ncbi:hypothetical protein RYX36_028331 [Vicia faba]
MFIRNEKQQQQQQRKSWARDRVIDFGKYKGKMLGSLPSSYLKWVSKNLRARDFEEWAILADQVLVDPIYRDRIEWEFALNVLDGNSARSTRSTEPADSQLQEISERFGWDKIGWSKVDFDLLGTSKGGRIPRLGNPTEPKLPPAATAVVTTTTTSISITRRMERRDRLKMRSTQQQQQQQQQQVVPPAADIKQVANPFPGRQALLRKAINHRADS